MNTQRKKNRALKPLTEKQMKVLLLICREIPTTEIARRLKVSRKAIEGHRENIRLKTKSKTNIGIYRYALTHKLIKLKNVEG